MLQTNYHYYNFAKQRKHKIIRKKNFKNRCQSLSPPHPLWLGWRSNACGLLEEKRGNVEGFKVIMFHSNRKMMVMMVPTIQTYTIDVIWWSNKVLTYYNFVLLLWTVRKENSKSFCVIDLLNEQHIVIIEESHDWPNIL